LLGNPVHIYCPVYTSTVPGAIKRKKATRSTKKRFTSVRETTKNIAIRNTKNERLPLSVKPSRTWLPPHPRPLMPLEANTCTVQSHHRVGTRYSDHFANHLPDRTHHFYHNRHLRQRHEKWLARPLHKAGHVFCEIAYEID